MKAKEIQELIDFISNTGLAEVKIETDEFKLSIKKNSETSVSKTSETAAAPAPSPSPAANQPVENAIQANKSNSQSAESETRFVEIKSPMIGTFYRSSNPDSDPIINVGDTIKAGQTVCIIEAMKLFNEIDSEVSGKIVKVLVDNASPVEYDQPLFLIEPAD